MQNISNCLLFGLFRFVGRNQLPDPIPSELGMLKLLDELYLCKHCCTSSGELCVCCKNISKLSLVSIVSFAGENFLSGQIPSEMGLLTQLTGLYLCKHCRTIQCWHVCLLSQTQMISNCLFFRLFLFAASNRLTGQIPSELGHNTQLRELRLSK